MTPGDFSTLNSRELAATVWKVWKNTVLDACILFILRTHSIVKDTQSFISLAMDCHRVSIWLAQDGTLNTYVAIKIPTAETPKIRNELECLKYLVS